MVGSGWRFTMHHCLFAFLELDEVLDCYKLRISSRMVEAWVQVEGSWDTTILLSSLGWRKLQVVVGLRLRIEWLRYGLKRNHFMHRYQVNFHVIFNWSLSRRGADVFLIIFLSRHASLHQSPTSPRYSHVKIIINLYTAKLQILYCWVLKTDYHPFSLPWLEESCWVMVEGEMIELWV